MSLLLAQLARTAGLDDEVAPRPAVATFATPFTALFPSQPDELGAVQDDDTLVVGVRFLSAPTPPTPPPQSDDLVVAVVATFADDEYGPLGPLGFTSTATPVQIAVRALEDEVAVVTVVDEHSRPAPFVVAQAATPPVSSPAIEEGLAIVTVVDEHAQPAPFYVASIVPAPSLAPPAVVDELNAFVNVDEEYNRPAPCVTTSTATPPVASPSIEEELAAVTVVDEHATPPPFFVAAVAPAPPPAPPAYVDELNAFVNADEEYARPPAYVTTTTVTAPAPALEEEVAVVVADDTPSPPPLPPTPSAAVSVYAREDELPITPATFADDEYARPSTYVMTATAPVAFALEDELSVFVEAAVVEEENAAPFALRAPFVGPSPSPSPPVLDVDEVPTEPTPPPPPPPPTPTPTPSPSPGGPVATGSGTSAGSGAAAATAWAQALDLTNTNVDGEDGELVYDKGRWFFRPADPRPAPLAGPDPEQSQGGAGAVRAALGVAAGLGAGALLARTIIDHASAVGDRLSEGAVDARAEQPTANPLDVDVDLDADSAPEISSGNDLEIPIARGRLTTGMRRCHVCRKTKALAAFPRGRSWRTCTSCQAAGRHRSQGDLELACVECGTVFATTSPRALVCSKACANERAARRRRESRGQNGPKDE